MKSLWSVSGWTLGNGNRGTAWRRLTMLDWIRAWWHRHIAADEETSRICAAIDAELSRREMEERIRRHIGPRVLHGTAEGYGEQMREIGRRGK